MQINNILFFINKAFKKFKDEKFKKVKLKIKPIEMLLLEMQLIFNSCKLT